MEDKDLIDALDAGKIQFNQFRRRANGKWEWWCQKDGPPNNRWVMENSMRDCLSELIAAQPASTVSAKKSR